MNKENEVFEGDITVKSGVVYSYTKITGSINARGADTKTAFPRLQSVGGYVDASANAKLSLPVCTSVGGYVYASANAKLSLPVCTSIGGSVDASANAKLSLPVCTSIGGYVYARENAELSLPKNFKQNDPTALQRCRAILLSTFADAGFSFADGILARIVSKRGPVSRVVLCGHTEVSYLLTDGESFSHGKTLAEARDGLLYKIGSRDTTEFKAWKMDREVSKRDAIRAYRTITGACETGTRAWMEQHEIPEKITVKGIIDLTKGAYGSESFRNFFSVKLR